jgi:hypothetical protein
MIFIMMVTLSTPPAINVLNIVQKSDKNLAI